MGKSVISRRRAERYKGHVLTILCLERESGEMEKSGSLSSASTTKRVVILISVLMVFIANAGVYDGITHFMTKETEQQVYKDIAEKTETQEKKCIGGKREG